MPSEMKRLKLLQEENVRLKRLVADLSSGVCASDLHWQVQQSLFNNSWLFQ